MNLKKPIIALSPMDGVTDAVFRKLLALTSKPSFIMTEFVNVEGLSRGAVSMLKGFEYSEIERPIIAQVYGTELDSFYKVAFMVCKLGFDGIDINMGCPMRKIAKRGAGAGLIQDPEHAKKIIRVVKKAVEDWANGKSLEDAGVRPKLIKELNRLSKNRDNRKKIPVSVKTRIGYDLEDVANWIPHLLEEKPSMISLHGRSLKQMYSGLASWEVIAKGAQLVKGSGTLILGNGDIKSYADAKKKIKDYGVDGVLIGRATQGNPWFFSDYVPRLEEKCRLAIQHSKLYEEIFPEAPFFPMRKHLAWYFSGFEHAKQLRVKLMGACSALDVEGILKDVI